MLIGWCSCIIFGDFGQLPPVMDLPLFTTETRTDLFDQGQAAYLQFEKAYVFNQVIDAKVRQLMSNVDIDNIS